MQPKTTVYVLDRDAGTGRALEALLGMYNIPVLAYRDAADLLSALRVESGDQRCLLVTLAPSGPVDLQVISDLRSAGHRLPIIALSARDDDDLRQRVKAAGGTDLISKSLLDTYVFTRLAELLPGELSLPTTPSSTMLLQNGTEVTFRMMHPEDAALEQQFVMDLSEQSRYLRFFSGLVKLPPHMLRELTTPDYPISYALIATIRNAGNDGETEIGVARYAPTEHEGVVEFAVVVADDWQGLGIASQLLRGVIAAAAVGGAERIEGLVLRENAAMLALAEKMGFSRAPADGDEFSVVRIARNLRESPARVSS